MLRTSLLTGLMAALLLLVGAAGAQTARPPVAAFARMPAIQMAEIAPGGGMIAILGGTLVERTLTLNPIDGAQSVTVPLGQVNVRGLRWAGDAYVIVQVEVFIEETNMNDGRVYRHNLQRDIVIDTKGKIVGMLLDGINWSGFATSRPILAVQAGPKPTVVMQGLDYIKKGGSDIDTRLKQKTEGLVAALWRVDVATGQGRMIERGLGQTQGWMLDASGEPRVRFDHDKGQISVLVRAKKASGWTVLDRSEMLAAKLVVLGYSDPEDAVYLLRETPGAGQRIYRRTLADGVETEIGPQAPAADAEMLWDIDAKRPLAIVSGGGERPTYQWLDEGLAKVHARLSRALKGKDVQIVSWSADRTRLIIRAEAPNAPPAWYLFETQTNQASPLGDSYPELAGKGFGKTEWLAFKAADGLALNAYLTLPDGLPPGVKPPLVVLVHGGPASRDDYAFDWWAQFLVSRGYAVLQPQFRGSSGFGSSFIRAGDGEWGGKMQTDLTDAIAAVQDRVDAGKVCIVGASYGGYAALYGAVFKPERYRCAIAVNAVADLPLMVGHARIYGGSDSLVLNYFRDVVGDPRAGADLASVSPARRAGARTSPLLLAWSVEDTTVPPQQSQLMEAALKRAGSPYQSLILAGDDHYLSSGKSRLQLLEASEGFLARYLAP